MKRHSDNTPANSNLPRQAPPPAQAPPTARRRSKRLKVTPDVITYLRTSSASSVPYSTMASHLGVCVDTVKRMLSRYDIEQFSGAKYAFAPETKMWLRPCMKCACVKPRPKNSYFCVKCSPSSEGASTIWDDF